MYVFAEFLIFLYCVADAMLKYSSNVAKVRKMTATLGWSIQVLTISPRRVLQLKSTIDLYQAYFLDMGESECVR